MSNRIFCAIDTPDLSFACTLADSVEGAVGGLKLGLEFFSAHGPDGVRRLQEKKLPIFLDLKLFDIPSTVAKAVTDARIRRELGRDPLKLGYNALDWTAPLLAKHLSTRYECDLSADTLRRRMRRMDLRWKRPRHAFTGKDPNRAQKKAQSFED